LSEKTVHLEHDKRFLAFELAVVCKGIERMTHKRRGERKETEIAPCDLRNSVRDKEAMETRSLPSY
jgi:hypothetical protein